MQAVNQPGCSMFKKSRNGLVAPFVYFVAIALGLRGTTAGTTEELGEKLQDLYREALHCIDPARMSGKE